MKSNITEFLFRMHANITSRDPEKLYGFKLTDPWFETWSEISFHKADHCEKSAVCALRVRPARNPPDIQVIRGIGLRSGWSIISSRSPNKSVLKNDGNTLLGRICIENISWNSFAIISSNACQKSKINPLLMDCAINCIYSWKCMKYVAMKFLKFPTETTLPAPNSHPSNKSVVDNDLKR